MKTVKQIADETGKSKTAIMQKIENLGLRNGLRKNANQFAIDGQQETLIKSAFASDKSTTDNRQPVGDKSESLRLVVDLVSTLQEQIKVKDGLITEQQQTIRELTTALENTTTSLKAAQALHAGTMQRQLTDGGVGTDGTQDTPEGAQLEPERVQRQRQSIFSRLFGRRE